MSQSETITSGRTLQLHTSIFPWTYLQPNASLRVGVGRRFWDIHATAIFPILKNVKTELGEEIWYAPFESFGGMVYAGPGWWLGPQSQVFLKVQMGVKYYATGLAIMGDGVGLGGALCTIDRIRRLGFGPKVLIGRQMLVSSGLALEVSGGLGFRMRAQWLKAIHYGEVAFQCIYEPGEASAGYPLDWEFQGFAYMPTLHFGLGLSLLR